MVHKFPVNNYNSYVWSMLCSVTLSSLKVTPHGRLICFACWNNTWEFTNSTIIVKWELMFINGCQWMHPISTVTEFLIACQRQDKCTDVVKDYVQKWCFSKTDELYATLEWRMSCLQRLCSPRLPQVQEFSLECLTLEDGMGEDW